MGHEKSKGNDFAGRRILITGAGSGIGAATAALLAANGARIGILDRDAKAAEATAANLGINQGLAVSGDVTDPQAVDAVLGEMTGRWGGIDDLVNNAGTWDHGPLLELSLERWRNVFDVNLFAPIAIANAAAARMAKGGSIVNVSSVLGQVAAPGRGPYCVSKSALIALTRIQAVEWASRGIRVNAIAPGYIWNDTTRAMAEAGGFDAAAVERRTPLARFGNETEVAEGIAYLLSPRRAAYVTGHVLEVNGGWTAYGYT
jgi:NAD(P)-dependent dehydrogenase (short-subunit alcohol dehydrogenase family)